MAATMKKHPLKLIMIISYIKYGMNQLGLACKKRREKNKAGTVRTEMNVYHFYRRHHNQFPVVRSDGWMVNGEKWARARENKLAGKKHTQLIWGWKIYGIFHPYSPSRVQWAEKVWRGSIWETLQPARSWEKSLRLQKVYEKKSQKSDDELRSSTVSSHLIMLRAQHHKKK